MKNIIYFIAFLFVGILSAQDYNNIIASYLNENRSQLGVQSEDIAGVKIKSHAFSKSMNLENIYVSQYYEGIEIFNSIANFAVQQGSVVYAETSNFKTNISKKINRTNPGISSKAAIIKVAQLLGLEGSQTIDLIESTSSHEFLYSKGSISLNNIPVKLVYQPTENNELKLAWDLNIYLLDASHYYSVRVDAISGKILETHDWVTSCNFGFESHTHASKSTYQNKSFLFKGAEKKTTIENPSEVGGGAQYRVFPLPYRSPNDGPSQIVTSPENLTASPFGWHDTDGVGGAEFTITRGNNVWAQEDQNGNNGVGASPDGGSTLNFVFPYGLPQDPLDYTEAATTNLFYWNNILHDIVYQYGFDEENGNFQQNNYGNGGASNDFVFADAQDGSGTNNANFGTPPDGISGRMQMFLWTAPGQVLGTYLTINSPGNLAGQYFAFDSNYGGEQLPTTPLTADFALLEDDNSGVSIDPNDGCDPITNGAELNGKIVVIRRGECNFTDKIANAEAEGAIAVIMVNNVPGDPIPMGGDGAGIGIPAIMIYASEGEEIIDALINSTTVNGTLQDDGSGDDPFRRDGDIDNVIVSHEYTHGISNRLTGGPSAVGCLQNEEQMGEGWSDYVALMLTMKTGDQGEDIKPIGTYALGQGLEGAGFPDRLAPYSTDFSINDYTYGNTNAGTSQPHGIGFVWCTMLWDLTWAFIDEYGYDPDIYNGTGGNNIALQLVIDGMKLQSCSPGFVDARNGILMADELTNNGENRCLIWEAFANRGLGASADQGSKFDRSDQTEAFDLPTGPDCTLTNNDRGFLDRNFIIYPNPSNGIINIKSIVNVGDVTISVFDMNGRKVFSKIVSLSNTVNINASGLTSGVYVIKINGNNYSHTARILIR